jgi:hypothetical protein
MMMHKKIRKSQYSGKVLLWGAWLTWRYRFGERKGGIITSRSVHNCMR